ncbi:MAG: hypothetical protein N2512_05355 [Armatimonadetes bacterium]|nr:hypothetical protein [Armatimonadota bacterium]
MRYLAALAAIVLGGLCLGQGPRHTEQEKAEDARLLVLGQVTWAGLDWTPAGGVLAASDPRFKDVVATAPLNREGRFVLFIEPGTYYLMAYVDVNANGRPDAPDGVGFYGVRQPTDAPAPLEVLPDSPADPVAIEVVFQLDEDRKLRRAAIGQEAALGCVRGVVQGNRGMHVYVVCWPAGDGWIGHASTPAADGSFEIPVPAGDYVVFAVCDSDGDGVVQPGDPAGILAENGVLRVARVLPQEHVELAAMELNGKLNEAGQVEVGEQAIELPGARIPALCRLAVPEGLQALPRQVLLFAEAAHKTLLARAWAPSEALLALRPATYYLVCGFDQDRDGQLGPGDALAAPVAAGGRRGLSVQEATVMDVVLGEPVALSGDLVDGKRTGGQQ